MALGKHFKLQASVNKIVFFAYTFVKAGFSN